MSTHMPFLKHKNKIKLSEPWLHWEQVTCRICPKLNHDQSGSMSHIGYILNPVPMEINALFWTYPEPWLHGEQVTFRICPKLNHDQSGSMSHIGYILNPVPMGMSYLGYILNHDSIRKQVAYSILLQPWLHREYILNHDTKGSIKVTYRIYPEPWLQGSKLHFRYLRGIL